MKIKEKEVERIEIPIQRTVATHKYCCICFSTKNLTTVSEDARNQCYIKKKIYIPVGNRCCKNHIIKTRTLEIPSNEIPSNERSRIRARYRSLQRAADQPLFPHYYGIRRARI